MPAPHPRMHGITHVAGGPDPVPGLISTGQGNYSLTVLAHPCLQHYWRGGTTDEKGDWDLTVVPADVSGVTYPHVGGTGPITGDDGGAVTNSGVGGVLPDDHGRLYYAGTGTHPPYWAPAHPWTIELWALLTATSDINEQRLLTIGGSGGYIHLFVFTDDKMYLNYSGAVVSAMFPAGSWVHVVARYTGTVVELIFDGVIVDSLATGGSNVNDQLSWLNVYESVSGWVPWNGSSSDLAIYDCDLTNTEIAHHGTIITSTGQAPTGTVLTSDGNGGYSFQPPAVEVEHGGGTPTPVAVLGPPGEYDGEPANATGWHYAAHQETAVLYDSTPARFDVPSRKWVRVPFNTVRLQRRWENETDGLTTEAWLADDRGLTSHARNGQLHITAEMLFGSNPQTVGGWFSIEYPVLDYLGLPDDDIPVETGPIVAPDAYVRAARMVNTRDGHVLRIEPGSSYRRFFEWRTYEGGGERISVDYPYDNPYPIYPIWAPRPLTKPLPYPQLGVAESFDYYVTPDGWPGFIAGNINVDANLEVGDNICLQAWQDTPWLLRFSTDHFPHYIALDDGTEWGSRPYLAITYNYDPDSIDHGTGELL